jgi:hypothetical protein
MSYQAVKQITSQLEAGFAEFDQKVADGTVEYLKCCFVALQAAKEEFKSISRDVWAYYPKLYEAAGGKGNFNLIKYGVSSSVEETVRKSEKLKADKRNTRIAKKLEDCGITSVNSTEVTYSPNGFNGVFEVETDKGPKKVIVETIFAWGEIQCPHFRVLVKVK